MFEDDIVVVQLEQVLVQETLKTADIYSRAYLNRSNRHVYPAFHLVTVLASKRILPQYQSL
jgi:hypothetical protein